MTTKPGGDRGYKRSWKNLLINKRYQLRFTMFMVGLSAALMAGLGAWVMHVANETTTVSATSKRGVACPAVPTVEPPADDASAPALAPDAMRLDEPGAGSAAGSAAPAPARRIQVQIDESTMTLTPSARTTPPGPAFGVQMLAHVRCEATLSAELAQLERGRLHILWAMILTGLALVVGLAIYGIKMTHRVAGPLFKVSLYLHKMRDGRYDKVYNLRKGDQLLEFYDHFKLAHGGAVKMQEADIAKVAAVVAAADATGLGSDPAVAELRALLARKEKSIE